jgi:3-oxoacyl-[acyl-carrier protein] reductase
MFMSVVERQSGVEIYPELAGARVLITGLTSATCVDIARGFADHKARLVLQADDASPELTALASVLAETSADIKLHHDSLASEDAAVRFAQGPALVYGGLDTVINLVTLSAKDFAGRESLADIEDLASEKLLAMTLITRVIANRMRVTWSEGLILNVLRMPEPQTASEAALAGVLRTALAAMTRTEAAAWAGEAIRINAIGPRVVLAEASSGAHLTNEADIAALALHLASKKGRQLTGHVFDAAGIATRRC